MGGWSSELESTKDALAKAQHHDAATGTNPSMVERYYIQQLKHGDNMASNIGVELMNNIANYVFQSDLNFTFCNHHYFTEHVSSAPMNQLINNQKVHNKIVMYLYC